MSEIENLYYALMIKQNAPKNRRQSRIYHQSIAEKLKISYFTLKGKINGYGKFTKKQITFLAEMFNGQAN